MSGYESIMLIGGPVDGDTMQWEGGDYYEHVSRSNFNTFTSALLPTKSFKSYPTETFTYKRDRRLATRDGDAVFVWTGEPK